MGRHSWAHVAFLILLGVTFAGCVGGLHGAPKDVLGLVGTDQPLHTPKTDFFNRIGQPWGSNITTGYANDAKPFHTLDELKKHIEDYAALNPGLVHLDVIGKSRQGRPIWHYVVSDFSSNASKVKALIDGGHHGNEIAGTELALYTTDFLLENAATNRTVQHILQTVELHVVPLVNPDGYAIQQRGNALGVNLNRNYDIDWGDPYGASNPVMGILSAKTGQNVPSVTIVAENCGDKPFSEPESQAMRDLMEQFHENGAFYLTLHTPANGFIAPWAAGKAPFQLPAQDSKVFESELQYVRTHTEYAAGKAEWGNFSAGLPYSASGSSQDWMYMKHHVASYTLELEFWVTSIVDPDFASRIRDPYAGLPYWMKASLPVSWHLLVNAENYAAWKLPTNDVPLPAGVPPPVPKGGIEALASFGYHRYPDEGAADDPGTWLAPLSAQ